MQFVANCRKFTLEIVSAATKSRFRSVSKKNGAAKENECRRASHKHGDWKRFQSQSRFLQLDLRHFTSAMRRWRRKRRWSDTWRALPPQAHDAVAALFSIGEKQVRTRSRSAERQGDVRDVLVLGHIGHALFIALISGDGVRLFSST
jgi:hypothetical protein